MSKAALMPCLEQGDTIATNRASKVNENVLNGPANVHMLRTGTAGAFENYAEEVFVPYIASQRQFCSRVDIVWNV